MFPRANHYLEGRIRSFHEKFHRDRGFLCSLSFKVIVPSKSVKKMNFGFVFMAGRSPILESWIANCAEGIFWMALF